MKRSEVRQIIREEIKKIIKEENSDIISKVEMAIKKNKILQWNGPHIKQNINVKDLKQLLKFLKKIKDKLPRTFSTFNNMSTIEAWDKYYEKWLVH